MSFYGAIRAYMAAAGNRDPAGHRSAEELPPMKDGAWAAWARPEERRTVVADWRTDHCRMPDGQPGRIVAVFIHEQWTLVCEAE